MGKYADCYFKVDSWRIVEEGFNPAYSMVAESVFSLGNEHMGLRGYFEEGYSGARLQGSYVNGVYERREANHDHYKGVPGTVEYMVNTVDWLRCEITCLGKRLDLNASDFSSYSRILDMRTGELTRRLVWHVDEATDIELTFARVLSMEQV
jgi:maltose phosphorylase